MKLPPHYSPVKRSGDLIFTSGQLPILPGPTLEKPADIKDQTRLVLKKVEDLLIGYGLNKEHIIKTTAFITKMEYWDEVNEVYSEFFGAHKPARSIIPIKKLHFGCLIELEAIASFIRPE